jgi:hypothetical protein
VSLFGGLFGNGRRLTQARNAELSGDFIGAISLYSQANAHAEAARVMLLRGDSEPDPRQRLVHYTQALHTAPEGSLHRSDARRKRAELRIRLAGDSALSSLARHEVMDAAKELEDLGEGLLAANAYRLIGDSEGEARALSLAGELERLEFVLSAEQEKTRTGHARDRLAAEAQLKMSEGLRREALVLAEQLRLAHPEDRNAQELLRSLTARRVSGPKCNIALGSSRLQLLLGDEITVGRTEGSLQIASSAISRAHLRIYREGSVTLVTDLQSRNGTTLRGVELGGPVAVTEPLELRLGGEIRVRVSPSSHLSGALDIELGGERYTAPLGRCGLGIFDWVIAPGEDGWLELNTGILHPPFQDGLALGPRTTLLRGDEFSRIRGEMVVLRIVE